MNFLCFLTVSNRDIFSLNRPNSDSSQEILQLWQQIKFPFVFRGDIPHTQINKECLNSVPERNAQKSFMNALAHQHSVVDICTSTRQSGGCQKPVNTNTFTSTQPRSPQHRSEEWRSFVIFPSSLLLSCWFFFYRFGARRGFSAQWTRHLSLLCVCSCSHYFNFIKLKIPGIGCFARVGWVLRGFFLFANMCLSARSS
jgi:hypothetical protein